MPKTTEPKEKVEKEKEPKEKTPREPKDLTPNMVKVLNDLYNAGSARTASEIALSTSILKGKRLPQLVEKGYLVEFPPKEGERGKKFKITAAGRKALDKALKEQAKS